MRKYRYKITLIDNQVIDIKSKTFISNLSCVVVKNTTYLHFEEEKNIYINVDHIKKITVNGVEYQVRRYPVH